MEHAKIAEMVEYSDIKRVRKRVFLSDDLAAELVCYEPAQGTPVHHHPRQDEIFYVIEGRGTMSVGEEVIEVAAGSDPTDPNSPGAAVPALPGVLLLLLVLLFSIIPIAARIPPIARRS